jgi:hypothetical protein
MSVVTVSSTAWTKVAENVTEGFISVLIPTMYIYTFVLTSAAAPSDEVGAVALTERFAKIENDVAIDVYMKARGNAGSVRVDL